MEVAFNTVVASSTHSFQLLDGRYATLLESNKNKNNINTANNGVIGVSQSILNFFEAPKKFSNDREAITLKNALNMNTNNDKEIDVRHLIANQESQLQLLQCNNSNLPLESQQATIPLTTTTDLLAALKITNTNTKINENRQNSSNASNLTKSPPSTPLPTSLIVEKTTTNSHSSILKAVSTGTPGRSNNSVVSIVTKNGLQIPSDILDDLASRFIINVPDMELSNLIRICFQIELAHWFYLDFFCAASGDNPHSEELRKRKLPTCGMKQFAIQIFKHIPFLREHLPSIDKILDDWKNYKLAVPTYGAILISEDLNYCLLVQSYFAKSSWGFPKGKVNENEDPVHCATREVYEETGYDITKLIVPNDYIEAVFNYQYTRLYIVRNVSLDTQFSPRTRNEIKCCDWFPIDSLPVNKNDAISKAKLGINANSFFMIMPFVKRLKKWVHDKRSGIETRRKFSGGGRSISPETMNSPTSLWTTVTVATPTTLGGSNQNNINQKQTNVNNSSKKNKQHTINIDDKPKASNINAGTTCNNGNNNGILAIQTSTNKNNSNRSKRQRHKSMGDLDCNSNNNFKNSVHVTAVSDGVESPTEPTLKVGDSGNCRTASNHKRNGSSAKHLAAGSNNNNTHNNGVGCTPSKRQLSHSQSQNGCNQSGEKIVSSFDLIRKERQQQLKAAAQAEKAAKAQKQQQQQQQQQSNASCNNSGRVRAKSQGDKMCVQNTNKTNTNNNGGNNKHRVQKQISMSIVNSNATANNDNNKSNRNNNVTHNTATHNTRVATSPTSSASSSGAELLAFAAKSSAAPSMSATTNSAQKPRPASVSSHFVTSPNSVASGTNLRILNRSTSYQPLTEQQELQTKTKQAEVENNEVPRQQQAQLKFTPSFNSWTNFSFTKNFIANIFC
ncbi:mRNA decapping complex subunit 2 [Bactrocera tryoni]|uniref:mRNA decapping complex subunit 2 n=1 Tax=Bactrocera tryoni TaxID=59916 RepID=UPI001A990CA9|nr:mRNA decapping complex subunit 2 [Bactrocera tryoni]